VAILDGKVAVITGAARGIGLATARLFSEQGARVVLADLEEDVAREAADGLPGETLVVAGDLTAPGACEALIETTVDGWGTPDIIINNAGYTLRSLFHEMTEERFMRMLEIHLVVPYRVLRAAAPHLLAAAEAERERGEEIFRKVVNVSSVSGTTGNIGSANYASGKAGLLGLTKTLAKEWGPSKINVNAVAFGFIETRLTGPASADTTITIQGETEVLGLDPERRIDLSSIVPLGRAGTPEEAAGSIFLLCTPWADFVHGQVLTVNGGQMMGMS